jgi:N-acetylglutamate synthase-like GNAT family acetyltransferase
VRVSGAEVTTAQPSDVEEIEALVREAYEPYIPRIGGRPGPLEEDYRAIVAEERARVARRGGPIVGLLVTSMHADHVLVENLAVAASERGTGLGSSLLALADDLARGAGVSEVRLYTHEKMTENLAFYAHRGFQETGRRTEDGFTRVFFTRRVD